MTYSLHHMCMNPYQAQEGCSCSQLLALGRSQSNLMPYNTAVVFLFLEGSYHQVIRDPQSRTQVLPTIWHIDSSVNYCKIQRYVLLILSLITTIENNTEMYSWKFQCPDLHGNN